MEEDYKYERDILGFCYDIKGYCAYCRSEIRADEDYDSRDGELYHRECWIQKNLYIDTFDLTEDN